MLKELYEAVFHENGQIKLCGRDRCKALMDACYKIKPEGDFGCMETGFMQSENIKEFYAQWCLEIENRRI